jgi:cob(I)alamin adenosyltransferase
MVILSRIATKTGDEGSTHLADMSRVAKTHPRIEAIGSVAETNAILGLARSAGLPARVDAWTERLQHELFDLGADLATPLAAQDAPRIGLDATVAWDQVIADLSQELGPLRGFVLPGGDPGAAHLHLAVTVARRAERAAWTAAQEDGIGRDGGLSPATLVYLNRLSDLLFQMARAAGDPPALWQPAPHQGDPS